MFRHSPMFAAVCLALALPGAALAEVEVSGYLKNETAVFANDGQVTGEARSMLDDDGHDAFDLLKFQNQARFFINGDLGQDTTWHADINLIYDTEGVNSDYRGHRNYTAYDYLRELYLDTEAAGWLLRLGKQQVVWGTADGIKLLDIINPTDFRELNQDTMEDSRIPIWMLNAERDIGDSGNIQFIVSQHEENKIPGLNADGDAGQPFILLGVDSITGRVNGFRNVAPRLANVASSFDLAAFGGLFDIDDNGAGDPIPFGLTGFTGLTVDGFASPLQQLNPDGSIRAGGSPGAAAAPGIVLLNTIAQDPELAGLPAANGNKRETNLLPVTGTTPASTFWRPSDSSSAFEYMANATFATFNTFAAARDPAGRNATRTQYEVDEPDDFNLNYGARYRGYTEGGLNFSLNYFYHYDANPAVDLSWHDSATGERLTTVLATPGDFDGNGAPDFADPTGIAGGGVITRDAVPNTPTLNPFGQVTNSTTVLLRNRHGEYYGAVAPNPTLATSSHGTTLRFTEHYERIHSVGASFDYAFDTDFAPVVVRGEFLYDQGTLQPVVDKRLLAIGDLEGALRMEEQDMFRYVLGAEINVVKNLLVSAQFIQFINLDFEDDSRTCRTQTGITYDCSHYTGDLPTLHMTNGLAKGEEIDNFGSLFLSKPFGPSQEHRWNNITIYEEGGGWWNRFDVEYSFKDDLIGSFEWNHYWGDEDTTFGQFEDSSNLQVGLKYLF
jgi:hypothetical protein